MNAKVSGKNVVIKLPIDVLVTAFNFNPEKYDDSIEVKYRRKFAEGFAKYVNEFSNSSESGLTAFQECIDAIFDEMICSDEPYIKFPKEDE